MWFKSFSSRSSLMAKVAIAGAAAAFVTGAANANTIQLTTGDPTATAPGGSTSVTLSNVVDAIFSTTSGGPTTAIWQGVTFGSTNANINQTGVTQFGENGSGDNASNAGFTNSTPDANDTALLNLVNNGLAFNSSTAPNAMTAVISNLTANTNYRIDNIISLLGYTGSRTDEVSYNGGTPTSADTITYGATPAANANYIYDVYDVVNSGANGTITVDYSGTGQGPFYSALIVSSVPEPASAGLLAIGAVGLLLLKRRRTA